MPTFLFPNIFRDAPQLANADGTKVITRRPPEGFVSREAVPVREPCAGSLQTLHEARDVKRWGQLEEHVNVITYDTNFNHTCAVPTGFRKEEATEELGHFLVDER